MIEPIVPDHGKVSLAIAEGEERHLFLSAEEEETELSISLASKASLKVEIVFGDTELSQRRLTGRIDLAPDAKLKLVMADFSASDTVVSLDGDLERAARADCDVAAASFGSDRKKYDISFRHLKPDSYSYVRMYGVLSDMAALTFLGTSLIVKGAARSWTRQEEKIADLSVSGAAQASPVLRIDEDDVKASHGAALGKIPDETMFYLMSRGLTKTDATNLITIGYLKPIVNEIEAQPAHDALLAFVEKRNYLHA